jgi:hypothetical protein
MQAGVPRCGQHRTFSVYRSISFTEPYGRHEKGLLENDGYLAALVSKENTICVDNDIIEAVYVLRLPDKLLMMGATLTATKFHSPSAFKNCHI